MYRFVFPEGTASLPWRCWENSFSPRMTCCNFLRLDRQDTGFHWRKKVSMCCFWPARTLLSFLLWLHKWHQVCVSKKEHLRKPLSRPQIFMRFIQAADLKTYFSPQRQWKNTRSSRELFGAFKRGGCHLPLILGGGQAANLRTIWGRWYGHDPQSIALAPPNTVAEFKHASIDLAQPRLWWIWPFGRFAGICSTAVVIYYSCLIYLLKLFFSY